MLKHKLQLIKHEWIELLFYCCLIRNPPIISSVLCDNIKHLYLGRILQLQKVTFRGSVAVQKSLKTTKRSHHSSKYLYLPKESYTLNPLIYIPNEHRHKRKGRQKTTTFQIKRHPQFISGYIDIVQLTYNKQTHSSAITSIVYLLCLSKNR